MRLSRTFPPVVLSVALLVACSSDDSSTGGGTAGADSSVDGEMDAADAWSESRADAAKEAGVDSAQEASAESAADGPQDSALDAGADVGDGSIGDGSIEDSSVEASPCDGAAAWCNGACVDSTTDEKNCGGCGVDCQGASCRQARCVRHAFVTYASWSGTMGGLAGADGKCQTDADESAIATGKLFKAWLSNGVNVSPDTRFKKSTVPYVLVDGTEIAKDWADLTDGSLAAAITLSAKGIAVDVSPTLVVWTDTTSQGLGIAGKECMSWSSTVLTGKVGNLTSKTSGWTDGATQTCDKQAHLYCFQQ
jgi:hypothetical protein